ncbi:MAG: hypothetical protein PF481_07570 [Bacteroidales bacterium]|jgi:hypothetical protein|nr:hypothetical protein [Bacteroidales bacterium]
MTRKGRDFEIEYEKLSKVLNSSKFKIESPGYLTDKLTSRKREVDILIQFKDENNINRIISIECRDRPKKVQDTTWIEQLVTKKNDLGIDILIATTTNTFSKSAIIKAKHYGIILEQAEKIDKFYIDKLTTVQYSILSFFYVKTLDLKLVDKRGIIYGDKFLKLNTTKDEKKKIEEYLNTNFIQTKDFSFVKEMYKTTKNGSEFLKNDFTIKLDINNDSVNLIENKMIKSLILYCYINSININVPLLNGVFIDYSENSQNSGFRKGYETENVLIEELKYLNYFSLKINYKGLLSKYLRFFQFLGAPFLRKINIENHSIFKIYIEGLSKNFLGKIDFEYFWNKR